MVISSSLCSRFSVSDEPLRLYVLFGPLIPPPVNRTKEVIPLGVSLLSPPEIHENFRDSSFSFLHLLFPLLSPRWGFDAAGDVVESTLSLLSPASLAAYLFFDSWWPEDPERSALPLRLLFIQVSPSRGFHGPLALSLPLVSDPIETRTPSMFLSCFCSPSFSCAGEIFFTKRPFVTPI